jgi:hypothetical protein
MNATKAVKLILGPVREAIDRHQDLVAARIIIVGGV